MTSESLFPNSDKSEGVNHRYTFSSNGESNTDVKWECWDGMQKEMKVEQFKWGIWTVLKAIKFHQFEQE